MRLTFMLFILCLLSPSFAQRSEHVFPAIRVTTQDGETFTILEATVEYRPHDLRRPEAGIVAERNGNEILVPFEDLLALRLMQPGESTQWYVVLTNGEVLTGPPGELRFSGTVGQDSQTHAGYISVGITPMDRPSHDYVSVIFPTNLQP